MLIMAESYCCFDHVVFLLDTPTFESPPSWLTDNFHITEGGEHTGGQSRNKLLIFPDGTYIELINFPHATTASTTKDASTSTTTPTSFPHWAHKPPGLIDLALTTLRPFTSTTTHTTITRNLTHNPCGLGITYNPPQPGGRKRKDSQQITWEITRPIYTTGPATPSPTYFPTGRIDVPFFCHDITPRILRVPWDDEDITAHPARVTGVRSVDVLVPAKSLTAYATAYSDITGSAPVQITGSEKDGAGVGIGKGTKGVWFDLVTPTSQQAGPRIVVRVPGDEEDERWLRERGVGVRSVALEVKGRSGHGEEVVGEGLGGMMRFVW